MEVESVGALPICGDCFDAGHRDHPGGCPLCNPPRVRLDPLRALERGRDRDREHIPAEERLRRERTAAAIAASRAARERPSELLRWIAEAVAEDRFHPAIDQDGNMIMEDVHEHDC